MPNMSIVPKARREDKIHSSNSSYLFKLKIQPGLPGLVFFLCLYLACLSEGTLFAEMPSNGIQWGKRVQAHIVVGDNLSACNEGFLGLQRFPDSKILWQAYLRALAKARDEKALLSNWRLFATKFPEERCNREILESLAWAVIENGASSASPAIRVIAMLGAYFSQDAKGVAVLRRGLNDSNSFLRGAALKLSSRMLDASLQDEVLRLFKNEGVWKVRLEAIKAVGALNIESARNDLENIIAQEKTPAEEKVAATEAMIAMSDGIDRSQIQRLVQSNRAGLRLLACELITYFEQAQDIDLLLPLIKDIHSEVRAKALHTLGLLRVATVVDQSVPQIAAEQVNDTDPLVGLTAAWVLTLNDQNKGFKAFEPFLQHDIREVRHAAAGALAATGKYGVPLAIKTFNTSNDPYVRMNLAVGLIGQREQTTAACDCLYQALTQQKERWMWEDEGNFKTLAPSTVKHDEAIPNYPEAVNQLVRLNILEMLAIVRYPHAQQAIKSFLQESNWGISGMASALLLIEGDEDAVDLVKGLLSDNDKKVRIQAALILALWGKGEDTVALLQDSYASSDKELKGQILEAVGRVGSNASLSFIAEKLQEPYQTLRIIAAAALLECLYH